MRKEKPCFEKTTTDKDKPKTLVFFPTITEIHKIIFKILIEKFGIGFDYRNILTLDDFRKMIRDEYSKQKKFITTQAYKDKMKLRAEEERK